MAQMKDISGIKQIIQPLEASGILVKRTDEEVCLAMSSSPIARYCSFCGNGNLPICLSNFCHSVSVAAKSDGEFRCCGTRRSNNCLRFPYSFL